MMELLSSLPKLISILERIARSLERIEEKTFPEEGKL